MDRTRISALLCDDETLFNFTNPFQNNEQPAEWPTITPVAGHFSQKIAVGSDKTLLECSNCKTQVSPGWRRCTLTGERLCNACGLYHRLHGKRRLYRTSVDGKTRAFHPTHLVGLAPGESPAGERTCSQCTAHATPVWRKGELGQLLCNACALAQKSKKSAESISSIENHQQDQ